MRRSSLLALATLALPSIALAVSFPDVPSNNLYHEQIETLADKGIVKGNPNGTFNPEGTVNRAELLTLLYRAAGKTPVAPTKACFKDVDATSWYSAVVCDSAKNGYVGGYPDGHFRPGNPVNRVESLKMIHTVLGLSVNASASMSPLEMFSDVSLTAWYTPYMASAFAQKILPIAGQMKDVFLPEAALMRGEVAAYIFNGLGLMLKGQSSSSASSEASSVVTRSSVSSSRVVIDEPVILDAAFPFNDEGSFVNKVSKVYIFTLTKQVTGSFTVTVGADETVQCRLYKLDGATSFAMEYYLGQRVENTCVMRVTLGAGNYQLEVVPAIKNGTFELTSKAVTGDDNDGFIQAAKLLKGSPKSAYLEVGDYAEFYTFSLSKNTLMTVSVSDDDNTSCLVYPMADVDLFGFSGPMCDLQYDYPAGTYYIAVTRRDQRAGKISFSVRYE